MRPQRINLLALTCIVTFLPCWVKASEIEKQLRAEYENKVLTMRQFYEGPRLRFDPAGHIVGDATIGPWTVDGQIKIKELHLHDRLLKLKGRRVRLVFDPTANRMKDAMGITANDPLSKEFPQFGDKRWREFEKSGDIEVELSLASVPNDENEVASAMNAVFLAPSDDLADFVPDFWKWFLLKQEGKSSRGAPSAYKVGQGVSPPRAIFAPDPQYSESARQSRFQGTTVMWLTVTPEGGPRDIRLVRPRGLGLDEKAVQAVSTWKFEPARKNGDPVPFQINVEVTFRLY